jgi:arsenite methyltransferase
MPKVQVFDPPMCCSSGVCGPKVDPVLPRFSADLDWLAAQGVTVERYNLAQQPEAFTGNEVVMAALSQDGVPSLPMILVDGNTASCGSYPSRQELAVMAGLSPEAPREADRPRAAFKVVRGKCCG